MKTFCKLTTQSPAASYVPLPRFLLQDEALRDISNDAKVLYALLLDRASISRQNGYVEPDGTLLIPDRRAHSTACAQTTFAPHSAISWSTSCDSSAMCNACGTLRGSAE